MSKSAIAESGVVSEKHREEFVKTRTQALEPITEAFHGWNEAVAFLVEGFHKHTNSNEAWHKAVANALRNMNEPLRSDFILKSLDPKLSAKLIKGNVRAFSTTVLEQNLEFMPREMEYPKFPYFQVEPATLQSLAESGLILLANPPAIDGDEPDVPGTAINPDTYLHRPMLSVELDLSPLPNSVEGAVLMNWSCKGRNGAKAKVFVNGQQHVKSFEVQTTDDDTVPNFWTFLPWKVGRNIVDLKHVGNGYLWFEHVDIHHVEWPCK